MFVNWDRGSYYNDVLCFNMQQLVQMHVNGKQAFSKQIKGKVMILETNIKMELNVLMLGGYRCGKTSVLTALFDQMINGAVTSFFKVCDVTPVNEARYKDNLSYRKMKLLHLMENCINRTFLVNNAPTCNICKYSFRLQASGIGSSVNINFIDVPGSFYNPDIHWAEINGIIRKCDVYIIAIDTPYLMAGGVSVDVLRAVNCIDFIQYLLVQVDDTKAKMVLFVPVKCEKWIRENKTDEIVESVEREYAATIQSLAAYPKMSVCILPVQTTWNILFVEMKEAYCVYDAEYNHKNRCCKIDDEIIRMWDGEIRFIKPNEIIYPNPDALILDTNLVRPDSWFCINPYANNQLYKPHNCEQLLLHSGYRNLIQSVIC